MIVDVSKIIVKDRIRKDFGDIQELAEDIRENGIINPPVINKDYELIAGERRLRALKMLGYDKIEVRMMDTRDTEHELNVEISENEVRKPFSKAERASYMKALLEIETTKAKERQGEKTSVRNQTEVIRADEEVAKQFSIGKDTLRKELAIVDNAGMLTEEEFADWDEGRLSTNKAYQKIKAENERLKLENENYSSMKEMIPELEDLVNTGVVTKAMASAIINELKPAEQKDLIESLDTTKKITKNKIKEAIKDFKIDNEDLREKIKNKTEIISQLQEQIDNLENLEEMPEHKLVSSSLVFCSRVSRFLEELGGFVWISTMWRELPDAERNGFTKAVQAVDDWVTAMKNNMDIKED